MPNPQTLAIDRQGYSIKPLLSNDATQLQILFDHSTDFFMMTNGIPAAIKEFIDVPDCKMPDDIRAFGLINSHSRLIGTLMGVQQYPDADTFWIGLMLLAPKYRGQGLGGDFYRAFEQWVSLQDYRYIVLCAIASNTVGRQFWQRMGFGGSDKASPRTYGIKTHKEYVYQREIRSRKSAIPVDHEQQE